MEKYNLGKVCQKPFVYRNELCRMLMLLLDNDNLFSETDNFLINSRTNGREFHDVLTEIIRYYAKHGVNLIIKRKNFFTKEEEIIDLSNGFEYVL